MIPGDGSGSLGLGVGVLLLFDVAPENIMLFSLTQTHMAVLVYRILDQGCRGLGVGYTYKLIPSLIEN